jgi:competence protein ComEC
MSQSSTENQNSPLDTRTEVKAVAADIVRPPIPYWLRHDEVNLAQMAPCVVLAIAFTLGIFLDRYAQPRLLSAYFAIVLGTLSWLLSRRLRRSVLEVGSLCVLFAGLGATRHNLWMRDQGPLDICRLTDERPRPIQVRGIIKQEPIRVQSSSSDPLRTQPAGIRFRSLLQVTEQRVDDIWKPARGLAELSVSAPFQGIHRGDEVELVGRLQAFASAMNPGESNPAERAHARGIHSQIVIAKVAQAVTLLNAGSAWSPARKIDQFRGYLARLIERYLPAEQIGLADALLIGDDTHLSPEDWDRYSRTGVVAVLVVSGQHLSLIAAWMWYLLCLAGIPRHKSALAVATVLVTYAFLTGAQPPIMRAAVMAVVFCGSFLVHRPALDINTLALAWLAVLAINPTDLFSSGCQLSFLSVIILFWGVRSWLRETVDPLERQIDLARPLAVRCLLWAGRLLVRQYKATFIFCLALAPLVALNYHTFAWQALLIGPLVVLFGEIALCAGFIMLVTGSIFPPVAWLAAKILNWSLLAADGIVGFADRYSGTRIFFADLPAWWIWLFYVGLAAKLLIPRLPTIRFGVAFGLLWLCLGGLFVADKRVPDELRCTFLAVGHGGCAVIETPDGRVVLYDLGSISGPEVARYHVQPYLWSRGIRKIDELILSHADLDHFNGLPQFLERFSIGRVTMTPTFSNKETPGVQQTMESLHRRHVETRIATVGDIFRAGTVSMHVLHPPEHGPPGPENVRSLVLLVQHQGHSILFTGDLEGAGRNLVLGVPIDPVDVLMAPHHGSPAVNDARLAAWANPKVVVSCEGPPRYPIRPNEPYSSRGIKFFGTWPHGAITIRSNAHGMLLETFASEQRMVIRRD